MSDLRDIPAIRAEAERVARDYYLAQGGHPLDWDSWIDGVERQQRTKAHLDLLADLTRPASMDAVARLVCAGTGFSVGMLLTDLEPQDYSCYGQPHDGIERLSRSFGVTFPASSAPFTDTIEALRLIAIHVLGAANV